MEAAEAQAAASRNRVPSRRRRRRHSWWRVTATRATPGRDGEEVANTVDCYGVGSETECVIPQPPAATTKLMTDGTGDVAPPPEAKDDGGRAQQGPLSAIADASPLVLLSPFFCWGTAMVAMKPVVAKTGAPFFVAAHRLIPAGALLLLFRLASPDAKGRPLVPDTATAWLAILVFAAVDATLFQGFLATGLKTTTAGIGSVIIDSQPITVFILAAILLGEEITPRKVAGLAAGVAGLVLLEVGPLEASLGMDGASMGNALEGLRLAAAGPLSLDLANNGELAMLFAAQSMAVGTILIRWVSKHADPVAATGWHLLLGGLPLAALSIAREDGLHLYAQLSGTDATALAYTCVLGCAVGYGIFFYLASRGSLTKLSSLTFTTPIFAAIFGYLLLGETLEPSQVAGAAVTLAGVSLIV